ncbi:MAG TPA: hypothetical protein G4O03_03790 [Dehalococcoidia bacterium]|nr:hypothetical protein [Dehalococcoidia bacterium]
MSKLRALSKIKRLAARIVRDEMGITGLETAIILIAFVVVASVFAYTVLSAGIFSSERGKEAVYAGLKEARGTLEPKGSVIATGIKMIDDADDDPVAWEAAATLPTDIISVTPARDTDDRKEGTASVELTIVTGVAPGSGLLAYHDLASAMDLSSQTEVKLWVKSDTDLTVANQLQLVLDDTAACASPLETIDIGTLTAGTWTRVSLTLANPSQDSAILSIGLNTGGGLPASTTIVVNLDSIEGDPPTGGEVHELIFTVANAVGGLAIDLTAPTDADGDGLADSGSTHVTVISYSDKDQQISDIAWSKAEIGTGDGDNLLETGEKMQITVPLKALTTLLRIDKQFTLEVKPPHGSSLSLQRTTPPQIDTIMNLQ